jgi:multidrug efflux system outer membrane protein
MWNVGCTVGPDRRTPVVPLPDTWSALPESGVSAQSVSLTQWWTNLNDPELNSLIDRAVQSNLDLQIAQGRIREARALRGVAAADVWPTLNVDGAYTRKRGSQNAGAVSSAGIDTDLFQSGFDAVWELDVFGRVRRAIEAAEATKRSAEENRRDVLVSLVAEVARNYVELRGVQQQLTVVRNTIAAQSQTVDLTRARFDAGLTSALDVAQAEAQLATTQAQEPSLESTARQVVHQVGVLLGQAPETLVNELGPERPIPTIPAEVIVGLPSELLRRRPDVRRAEQDLAAATARIGVATADLFPHFSLTSNIIGLQSMNMTDLPLASSRFWSVGPTLSWPLFDAGRIRANIEVQNAREEQVVAVYEKTVLIALQEVEDALVTYTQEQLRERALATAVSANQRAVDLASDRYLKGLGDFLQVLDAQRSLYTTEDQLVQSRRVTAANLIALYKAVGGGWEWAGQLGPAEGVRK